VALVSPGRDMDLSNGSGYSPPCGGGRDETHPGPAIVTSVTDSNVRVFTGGPIVLRLDPTVTHESHVTVG